MEKSDVENAEAVSNSLNPYRAPAANESDIPLSEYYALKSTALKVSELWAISTNIIQFAVLVMYKFVNHRVMYLIGSRIPRSIDELVCHGFRDDAQKELNEIVAEIAPFGFQHLRYFQMPIVGQMESFGQLSFNREQNVFAVSQVLLIYAAGRVFKIYRILFHTPLRDGRSFETVVGKREIDQEPECSVEYLPWRRIEAGWNRHLSRKAKFGSDQEVFLLNGEAVENQFLQSIQTGMEFHISRGIYERLNLDEVKQLQVIQQQTANNRESFIPAEKSGLLSSTWISLLTLAGLALFLVGTGAIRILGLATIAICALYLVFSSMLRAFRK